MTGGFAAAVVAAGFEAFGFDVSVVKDATAGARHPELGDGYKAALVNFGYIASAVLSTDEAVEAINHARLAVV